MRVERTEADLFWFYPRRSAPVRVIGVIIDAIFYANTDIQILAEPSPPAIASLEKPDKK